MPRCDAHEIVVGRPRKLAPGEGYWLAAEAIRRSAIFTLGISRRKDSGDWVGANAWAEKVRKDDAPWLLCELCVKYLGLPRADEKAARQTAVAWSHNRSTTGFDPDEEQPDDSREDEGNTMIPLTPEEVAVKAGEAEEARRSAQYPLLIDSLCCMMCASGPVPRKKLYAVLKILSKVNLPLSRREIEGWLASFIKRVQRNGLEEMASDTLVALDALKNAAHKERIWKCLQAVAMADGVLDPGERTMGQRFASVLWQGGDVDLSKDLPASNRNQPAKPSEGV